jgi:hypothetical protein
MYKYDIVDLFKYHFDTNFSRYLRSFCHKYGNPVSWFEGNFVCLPCRENVIFRSHSPLLKGFIEKTPTTGLTGGGGGFRHRIDLWCVTKRLQDQALVLYLDLILLFEFYIDINRKNLAKRLLTEILIKN